MTTSEYGTWLAGEGGARCSHAAYERRRICAQERAERAAKRTANRAERDRQAGILAGAGIVVEKRQNTRYWNLTDNGRLLAVTVYRRGAVEAGMALAEARSAVGCIRSAVAA